MSGHDAITKAWHDYHGPIHFDGEEDYVPSVPPLFKRGFVDGVEYAIRERDEARVISRRNTPSGSWISVEDDLPDQDEWVLHTYYGVRVPAYGRHRGTRFFDGDGPKSFPTTHWLPVPFIPEPNAVITHDERSEELGG